MRAPSAEICSENDGRPLLVTLTLVLTLVTLLRGGTTDAMMSSSTFFTLCLRLAGGGRRDCVECVVLTAGKRATATLPRS